MSLGTDLLLNSNDYFRRHPFGQVHSFSKQNFTHFEVIGQRCLVGPRYQSRLGAVPLDRSIFSDRSLLLRERSLIQTFAYLISICNFINTPTPEGCLIRFVNSRIARDRPSTISAMCMDVRGETTDTNLRWCNAVLHDSVDGRLELMGLDGNSGMR